MGAAAAGGGLLLLLLLAMSGGGGSSPTPPRPTEPDKPDDEPAGKDSDLADINELDIKPLVCEMLAKVNPFTKDIDFALQVLKGAFVGYDWAMVPLNSERGRLIQLTTEIVAGVRAGTISCDLPIEINPKPVAGGYYQIQYGNTPLGIIAAAYPWANAQERVALVKATTNHPANGGGVVGQGICVATQKQGNINIIGPVVFSMFKKWFCKPTISPQRFLPGSCYAVVFLPLIVKA